MVAGEGHGDSWLSFASNNPIKGGYTIFSGGIGRRREGIGEGSRTAGYRMSRCQPYAAPEMGGEATDIRIAYSATSLSRDYSKTKRACGRPNISTKKHN